MVEKLYPERLRCKTCRKKLETVVIDGQYDSYQCAGLPSPVNSIDTAPRCCKREVNHKWDWKHRYRCESEVPERLRKDPATNVYRCDNCHYLHVGHSRVTHEKTDRLERLVGDEKELGTILIRRREQKGRTRKQVAHYFHVPIIRITELETHAKQIDYELLFKYFRYLNLRFFIQEK